MFPWEKPVPIRKPSRRRSALSSNQVITHKLQNERKKETERNNLQKFVVAHDHTKFSINRENTLRSQRDRRYNNKKRYEFDLQNELNVIDQRKRAEKLHQMDKNLAKAISDYKNKELKHELEIKAICNQDPMLQELQHKIQLAYVNKERFEQLKQKKEVEQKNKLELAKMAQIAEIKRREDEAELQRQAIQRREEAESLHKIAKAQMKEKKKLAQLAAIKQYNQEKNNINQIVKRIQQEYQQKSKSQRDRSQVMKETMKQQIQEREALRHQQKLQQKLDDEHIARYQALIQERKKAISDERIQRQEASEAIQQRIKEEALLKAAKEEETRQTILFLQEEVIIKAICVPECDCIVTKKIHC